MTRVLAYAWTTTILALAVLVVTATGGPEVSAFVPDWLIAAVLVVAGIAGLVLIYYEG